MRTLTIRARVTEEIVNGEGFPKFVTVTGADGLDASVIRAIAQEAIDSQYGSYESGCRALFNEFDLREAEKVGSADEIVVRVSRTLF